MLDRINSGISQANRPAVSTESGVRSKILIHVLNFFPEFIGVGKYAGELAFSLADKGHQVEVVTAPPHYPGWTVEAPYRALRYARETIKGVDIWRCPILAKANGGGLWRLLAPLTFAAFAAPLVVFRILLTRPDVVVCVEPTLFSTPAALLAAKIVGARTILHVQDLEVDAAFEVHLKGNRRRRIATAIERMLLRSFDLTVTISRKMREALLRKGVEPRQCIVIRNWVDLQAIKPLPADAPNAFRAELGLPADKFVILYSGHIGKKQSLPVVLDAARLCQDRDDLHFVIAGEGPAKADLIEANRDLKNVSFLPLQPSERFNDLLNLANLHVLPQAKNTADLMLPSKLGGMLASGRPVVATADPETELGEILRGSAYLTPPEDAVALAEAVRQASRADLSEMSQRSRELAKLLSDKPVLAEFAAAIVGAHRFGDADALDAVLQAAKAHG